MTPSWLAPTGVGFELAADGYEGGVSVSPREEGDVRDAATVNEFRC
jgi:hypothetical protein